MAITVFIDGLPLHFNQDDLRTLFAQFGPVETAFVARLPAGRSLGFGYVKLTHFTDAQQAVERLNGTLVMGHTLTVYIADAPKSDSGTGVS